MKSIDKVILGGVVAASAIGINYNISNADIVSQETYTTINRLNMRKGPSTDYAVVGTLDKGVKVTAIEKSSDGKWLKINYNSQNVWVSFAYLQKDQSTNTDVKLDSQYETTANVNMRKGASTNDAKITIVPAQTKITPIKASSDGRWVQITYKNQTGWISAQYIKAVSTTPTPTPTPTQPNKVEVGKKYKTTAYVNARRGPGATYEVATVLPKGTQVVPLEILKSGYWVIFKHNDQYMYISTEYLESDNQSTTPVEPEKPTTGKLTGTYETTANLSLRKGAGTSYSRYLVIPGGSKVEASEITADKDWIKVTYNNQSGWVSAQYLKKVSSESETPVTPTPTTKDYYTTANLNIRDGASTSSSKIGQIPNGTKVSVVDFNSNKTWAKVVYNGKTGWVSAQYLSTKSQEPEQKEDTYWNGTTTQNLNMRKGPSTDYSIIITIPKNSDVKIYQTQSGWAKIKYKSYEGYCSASFIK